MSKTTLPETAAIQVDELAAEHLLIPIVGTSPLIVHRFSEKARKQMLDAMQGKKNLKQPKNPETEYQDAFYRTKDNAGYGFPVTAFKQATVAGARFYGKSVTMTALRSSVFFKGEIGADGQSIAILDGTPHMREDAVTVGRNGRDLRYRPQFDEWTTTLEVIYVTSMLTRGSLLSLIEAGGLGVGVGDWRPEKNGEFGTYAIDKTRDIKVL